MATGLGDLKKRPIPRPVRADGGAVKIKHEIIPPHRVPDGGLAESKLMDGTLHQENSSTVPKASNLPITGAQDTPGMTIGSFSIDALNASPKPDNNPINNDIELDKREAKTRQQLDKEIAVLSGYAEFKAIETPQPDNNSIITRQKTRQQLDKKPDKEKSTARSIEDEVLSLPKNPWDAFSYICDCLINRGGDYLRTSYKLLALETGIPDSSIRAVLKNQLRNTYKLISLEADGGGPQACINVFVDSEVLRIFIKVKHSKTRQQLDKKPDKKPDKIASSKIDMVFDGSFPLTSENKNLTVSNPQWFMSLDFSKMPKSFIPTLINKSVMVQAEAKFDKETLQDFIDRAPQFMAASKEPINSPVGFITAALQDYIKNGWTPVSSYPTSQELDAQALWAEEKLKIQQKMELIEKARELDKAEERQSSFTKVRTSFELWYTNASDEEKSALKAKNAFNALNEEHYKASLLAAYMEKNGFVDVEG